MDMMFLLLFLMLMPQLLGGLGGLFGGTASQQPIVNVYTNGVLNGDEDTTGGGGGGGLANVVTTWSSNPLGGDEDNPFDIALVGAGIGAAAGSFIPALGTAIGAGIGAIGGFLIDLWWL
jgi:hypothetical protein